MTTTTTLPVGTRVQVKPDTHREGQTATVVATPGRRQPMGVPGTVPLKFDHDLPTEDSHLPLWYSPDELIVLGSDPVLALLRDWVSLGVSNVYDRSTDFATDFAALRQRVIARCDSLGIEATPAILDAVPDWHSDPDEWTDAGLSGQDI